MLKFFRRNKTQKVVIVPFVHAHSQGMFALDPAKKAIQLIHKTLVVPRGSLEEEKITTLAKDILRAPLKSSNDPSSLVIQKCQEFKIRDLTCFIVFIDYSEVVKIGYNNTEVRKLSHKTNFKEINLSVERNPKIKFRLGVGEIRQIITKAFAHTPVVVRA